MATALILGVNGQDGSYLADSLLARGHRVVGIGRAASAVRPWPNDKFRYVILDLTDPDAFAQVVQEVAPDVVFHVAAVHGAVAAGFTYEAVWREVMQVNVLALHVLLEHARLRAAHLRIIYAGSAKVFPTPWQGVIGPDTPMRATCLYGISKLAARDLMLHYHREHGVKSTNLVLFNHESPRRPDQFLLPTVTSALAAALDGQPAPARVRALDFLIDWSAADEIMDMVVDVAFGPPALEFIVASGRTVLGRAVVADVFAAHGLDMDQHVLVETSQREPSTPFRVDIAAFASAAGRQPQKTALMIAEEITQSRRRRGGESTVQ